MNAKPTTRQHQLRRTSNAFSLVELLVSIAIIGLLISLILPAVNSAREAVRRIGCANNLRQIGIGLQNHESAKKHFPPGQALPGVPKGELLSWSLQILPYIEQQPVWSQIDFKSDLRSKRNRKATSTIIGTYLCPSSDQNRGRRQGARLTDFDGDGKWTEFIGEDMACIDYSGVAGPNKSIVSPSGKNYKPDQGILIGLTRPPKKKRTQWITGKMINDGVSSTLIVVESTTRSVWKDPNPDKGGWELSGTWASGQNIAHVEAMINTMTGLSDDPAHPPQEEIYSDHPGGANVLFVDSSVHFVDERTDQIVLAVLASRNGTKDWGETEEPLSSIAP